MPGAPGKCLASMGNYLFDPQVLRGALIEDSTHPASQHDFGHDLIPALIERVPVYAYNFMTNRIRGDSEVNLSYWRDVGTIDAYYEANMDLRDARPHLNLYNPHWPLRTAYYNQPPAKFVFDEERTARRGAAFGDLGGLYRVGRHGAQLGARALGFRAFVQPGRGFGADGLRARSGATRGFAARLSTRTSMSPRATKSATTSSATASASSSPTPVWS